MVLRERYTAECKRQENAQKNSRCRFTTESELKKFPRKQLWKLHFIFLLHKCCDKVSEPAISRSHFDVCRRVDDKIRGRSLMGSWERAVSGNSCPRRAPNLPASVFISLPRTKTRRLKYFNAVNSTEKNPILEQRIIYLWAWLWRNYTWCCSCSCVCGPKGPYLMLGTMEGGEHHC